MAMRSSGMIARQSVPLMRQSLLMAARSSSNQLIARPLPVTFGQYVVNRADVFSTRTMEITPLEESTMRRTLVEITSTEVTPPAAQMFEEEALMDTRVVGDMEDDTVLQLIKRTWQPSVLKRKRKHGFLQRISTPDGRKILERRKRIGRHRIVNI